MDRPAVITSKSNRLIIRIGSLAEKKYRDSERLFRFDGIKLFREAAACGIALRCVLVSADAAGADAMLSEAGSKAPGAALYLLSGEVFAKLSPEKSPEGIISVAEYPSSLHIRADGGDEAAQALSGVPGILALESVRDPGNLGTVIRSAAAFGTEALLLSGDCADIYNPRVLRAAMGAVFSRRIVITADLPSALRRLAAAGRRILGTTLSSDAVPLQDAGVRNSDIFVIGNEGHGLSGAVIAACDRKVFIPMERGPGIESLNAAVAASVIMYERKRC
ncbi:MAG: RNA methyltransferase [Clostridia bacterium]|nr:RNA methyltransferase [Clostridia bacterium]